MVLGGAPLEAFPRRPRVAAAAAALRGGLARLGLGRAAAAAAAAAARLLLRRGAGLRPGLGLLAQLDEHVLQRREPDAQVRDAELAALLLLAPFERLEERHELLLVVQPRQLVHERPVGRRHLARDHAARQQLAPQVEHARADRAVARARREQRQLEPRAELGLEVQPACQGNRGAQPRE